MIQLEALQEMFTNMRADTEWDVDGPLLWGFFFTDRVEAKLRAVLPALEKQGYRLVEIFVSEVDVDDAKAGAKADEKAAYFTLHVEKIETHSAASLYERNLQLHAFAELYRLNSYDGMDVGPIDGTSLSHPTQH